MRKSKTWRLNRDIREGIRLGYIPKKPLRPLVARERQNQVVTRNGLLIGFVENPPVEDMHFLNLACIPPSFINLSPVSISSVTLSLIVLKSAKWRWSTPCTMEVVKKWIFVAPVKANLDHVRNFVRFKPNIP